MNKRATGVPECRLVTVGGTGRVVGVYDYGDRNGYPVFAFHGTPSCGAGFDWADEPATRLGLHVIAPDRPGVGRSSRQAGWTVADYAQEVGELADVLGI